MFKSKILKTILFTAFSSSSLLFGAFDSSRRVIFTKEHELVGSVLFQRFAHSELTEFNESTDFIDILLAEENPTADTVAQIIHRTYFQYHPNAEAHDAEAMEFMTKPFKTVFACDPEALDYLQEKRNKRIQEHAGQ